MQKTAIVLCGGQGIRLRPYTITIPKPLMPLGDQSILEIVIGQLKKYGFFRIIFSVHYRCDFIKAYFQNGERFGVKIEYLEEKEPLGTIAPLRNVENLPSKFLVINGDILTDMNFEYYFQQLNPSIDYALVPVYKKNYQIDFGVMTVGKDGYLESFQEKPTQDLLVSMGAYFFSNKILDLIPTSGSFGFDQLMDVALEKNIKILCPIYQGSWLDIGRHEDYAYAQDHYRDLVTP